MKQAVLMSYFALIAALLLPCIFPEGTQSAVPSPSPAVSCAESPAPQATPSPESSPEPSAVLPIYIKVKDGDDIFETDMQSYLVGVVAAEMPADFHAEALKAQAVAARTYTLYCQKRSKHPDADVCTDFSCCQAYLSEAELEERWGSDFEQKLSAVKSAVDSTDGEYISYEGEAIFAAFHSSSAGMTEDCGRVWSALPYLVSVESPENSADVPGFISRVSCAAIDFRDTVLSVCPEADFSVPREQWIGETTLDDSGRVSAVVIGGVSVGGLTLRRLFSLRSTAFRLEYSDDAFIFTVTGYGHGVGMSQYGADAFASQGMSYTDILAHYYPGTEIRRL